MKKKIMLLIKARKIKSVRKLAGLLFIPALICVSCSDDAEPVIVSVSFPDALNNPLVKTIELADTTFKFGVSSDQKTEGLVEATVEADLSLVNSYNTANQTSYLPMVEGSYVLNGDKLTIPDGASKSDSLLLTINPNGKLEREKSYLLPVKIKNLSGNGTVNESYSVNYFVFAVKAGEVVLKNFNRSGWEIQCSSEETKGEGDGQGKAIFLLDNNSYTFWHSKYLPVVSEYPHWLQVNMNEAHAIRAFWIINCQESWATSIPKNMYFEVSADGQNWTRVAEVVATSTLEKQVFQLEESVTATYFKVTFTASVSGEKYCYLGELGASGDSNE
jgi:hypothetical protein